MALLPPMLVLCLVVLSSPSPPPRHASMERVQVIDFQLTEVEERLPYPTEHTADPAKKADSYKMAGAQVTQEQEKPLKKGSKDVLMLEDIINKQKPVKETTQQNAKQNDQMNKGLTPPDAESKSLGQVCSFSSWRDELNNPRFEMTLYALLLVTNVFNGYVMIHFVVTRMSQSHMYLVCMLLNSIPIFLVASDHFTSWDKVKIYTAMLLCGMTICLDVYLYLDFMHHWVVGVFAIWEIIGSIVVKTYGARASQLVQSIDGGTNFLSASILILFFLYKKMWEYGPSEEYPALLAIFYPLLSLARTCDTISMVLYGLACIARIIYCVLMWNRSTVSAGLRQPRLWAPVLEDLKRWFRNRKICFEDCKRRVKEYWNANDIKRFCLVIKVMCDHYCCCCPAATSEPEERGVELDRVATEEPQEREVQPNRAALAELPEMV